MSETSSASQEIIIVRRNSGDGDGGHHGGAWKIAYADFVTAMMAFFLVMWLVNSANEVTKSRVASYFNPIKMTDASANSRGLKNPTDKKAPEQKNEDVTATDSKSEIEVKDSTDTSVEKKILENPIAKLDEIMLKANLQLDVEQNGSLNSIAGDPFDPKAFEIFGNGKRESDLASAVENGTAKTSGPSEHEVGHVAFQERAKDISPKETKDEGTSTSALKSEDRIPAENQQENETRNLETAIEDLIKKHRSQLDISVNVRRTEEGLLVKLGDNSGKGMFAIGSAEPSAGLIEIVGVIGKLLSQQQGSVVVRGHTDGRPYKKGRRDNWQLSTARAHMASYMLMRGGLNESRIKSIEGHGAATPLFPSDPLSDSNRRVEFLLQTNGAAQ